MTKEAFTIKEHWFHAPDICHLPSPVARMKRKSEDFFSRLTENNGQVIGPIPQVFHPISITWTTSVVYMVGVTAYEDCVQTGTIYIAIKDTATWFRRRGNGMRCLLSPQSKEEWSALCNAVGAGLPE